MICGVTFLLHLWQLSVNWQEVVLSELLHDDDLVLIMETIMEFRNKFGE